MSLTFQEVILKLQKYYSEYGCLIVQPTDIEVGAGTFNPHTFLRALGPEPYKAAYVEPSRRPTDGRYGENPNRLQFYYQFQALIKPAPSDAQKIYLDSLRYLGIDLKKHDIRFVEDDWESPTLGAWGLGWEVWLDGMEITQFTYFQQIGSYELEPISLELTYGLERITMHLQNKTSVFDIKWNDDILYKDIHKETEQQYSKYNFELADTNLLNSLFKMYEQEAKNCIEQKLVYPAYDYVMKASHSFNLLDARGAISVSQRAEYIQKIRKLARSVAKLYLDFREELNYPLLKK